MKDSLIAQMTVLLSVNCTHCVEQLCIEVFNLPTSPQAFARAYQGAFYHPLSSRLSTRTLRALNNQELDLFNYDTLSTGGRD